MDLSVAELQVFWVLPLYIMGRKVGIATQRDESWMGKCQKENEELRNSLFMRQADCTEKNSQR